MFTLIQRFCVMLLLGLAALLQPVPALCSPAMPAIMAPDYMPANPHLPPDVLARMRSEDAKSAGQWNFHRHPVRDKGKESVTNAIANGEVQTLVSGTKSMPCALIKFPDQVNTYAAGNFQNMLFTPNGIATGSANDFYTQNSYGQLTLSGQVTDWLSAANSKSYYGYGNGDARAATLAKEAAQQADTAGFNWAPYDNNHDGYVDTLWLVHSGIGREESGNNADIWSHSWNFNSAGVGFYTTMTADPYHAGQYLKINNYIVMPESSKWAGGHGSVQTIVGIGVFCHEFGHALGLPDLYDTAGTGQGLGNASLMAGGSWGGNGNDARFPAHMDAWSKVDLGWITPTIVTSNGSYTVNNNESNQSCLLVKPLGSTTNQYFLVENRQHEGFDNTLFATGLFIYHIDTDVINTYRGANRVNVNNHPYGVALEEADATTDSYNSMHLFSTSSRGSSADSWPNGAKNAFTEISIPSTKTNAGAMQFCGITDIPVKSNAMTVNIYVSAFQPDLLIRTGTETSYLGNDVYNATGVGQTKSQNVAAGQTASYYYRVQNDGNTADSFTVTGATGSSGWAVGYVNNATGAVITGAVTGAGWNTGMIAPGQYVVVLLRVVPAASMPGGGTKEVWVQAQSNAAAIDVAKAITGVTTITKPDLMLRTSMETTYLGDNIYNATGVGQTKTQSVAVSKTAVYYCRVQNDGNTADSFVITGPTGSGGWAVGYVYNATGAVITGAVTGTGWNTGVIAPGQYVVVLLRVVPTVAMPGGTAKEIWLQVQSQTDALCVDMVKTVTAVTAIFQPDLFIRTGSETTYLGDNIYNATGTGQTKAQSVVVGQTATYYCRVQNDGNTADSFTITGLPGSSGWAVGYVNYATNAVITAAVTGTGWNTGVIAPGQYVVVVLRVVPSGAVSAGASKEVWLQAVSTHDATHVDLVKAVTTRQ